MYPTLTRKTGLRGEATPKQIEYAGQIHDLIGVELPDSKTKQAYSDYINRYLNKYKKAVKEGAG